MKILVIVGDGMGDHPIPELGNITPLQYARTPNMDRLARMGLNGMAITTPRCMEPGSDIANLSILGYDPLRYYPGRGPLEALARDVGISERDAVYRCNLVWVERDLLLDYSAGHIPKSQSDQLIEAINSKIEIPGLELIPGSGFRNLVILRDSHPMQTHPPHQIMGRSIWNYLPHDPRLRELMLRSRQILESHSINSERASRGLPKANMLWPWGGGKLKPIPSFQERYGIRGGMVCGVDLLKGISRALNLRLEVPPGATGYIDTDYEAKAERALELLDQLDLVYLHFQAPDEVSHSREIQLKIQAIQQIDRALGLILDEILDDPDVRLMLITDHITRSDLGIHVPDPVPFSIYFHGCISDQFQSFDECRNCSPLNALQLLPLLINDPLKLQELILKSQGGE